MLEITKHGRRALLTIFGLAGIGCHALRPSKESVSLPLGCPAVTNDARWSDIRWSDSSAGGSRTGTSNRPPSLPASFDPASLRGRFQLIVVATAGLATTDIDTIRRGQLVLEPTDTVHRYVRCQGGARCGNKDVTFPLFGAMDARFHFPGLQSNAVPFSRSLPDGPGVLVSFESTRRELLLIFGNPFLQWMDSGVFLEVFHADSNSFTGRWVNGGLVVATGQRGSPTNAQGHFCATRIAN